MARRETPASPVGLVQLSAEWWPLARTGGLGEALSTLARRVGGLADTIEDGVTGFLFDDYTTEGSSVPWHASSSRPPIRRRGAPSRAQG